MFLFANYYFDFNKSIPFSAEYQLISKKAITANFEVTYQGAYSLALDGNGVDVKLQNGEFIEMDVKMDSDGKTLESEIWSSMDKSREYWGLGRYSADIANFTCEPGKTYQLSFNNLNISRGFEGEYIWLKLYLIDGACKDKEINKSLIMIIGEILLFISGVFGGSFVILKRKTKKA